MRVELVAFGELVINGEGYDYDVVIEAGEVHKRKKKASKAYRGEYGHTPLSAEEQIPWGGRQLIIGTGMYGSLPIMDEVYAEAGRRGVKIIAVPTREACRLINEMADEDIYAVLHITC